MNHGALLPSWSVQL